MVTEETVGGLIRPVPVAELPGPLGLAVAALDRVLPIADRLARLLARLAAVGVAGAAVIWGAVAAWRWPPSPAEAAALAALALVLLVPAAVLLAYRAALLRYAAAADRLRALPAVIGQEADRVHSAVAGVRAARCGGIAGTVGAVRQLAGASRAFEEQLNAYSPLVAVEAGLALPLLARTVLG